MEQASCPEVSDDESPSQKIRKWAQFSSDEDIRAHNMARVRLGPKYKDIHQVILVSFTSDESHEI